MRVSATERGNMKSSKVTIQNYSGGPERSFFLRQGLVRLASIELMRDEAYKKLPKDEKGYYVSVASVMRCAAYEGLMDGAEITVAACDAFSIEYAMTVEDSEIPTGEVEENPTGTPVEI